MAVNNSNEMTREGYNSLNEELEHLITVVRKENAERLKEAISLGDISENAEYDAAKDAQAETEERITQIEEILRTAIIVDESSDNDSDDTVQTGRTVKVRDMKSKKEVEYKIPATKVKEILPVVLLTTSDEQELRMFDEEDMEDLEEGISQW